MAIFPRPIPRPEAQNTRPHPSVPTDPIPITLLRQRSPQGDDLTKYHAEAGFPSMRLHDMHWPCPDVYLAPIVKNGSQITYRLGTGMENRTRCYVSGGTSPRTVRECGDRNVDVAIMEAERWSLCTNDRSLAMQCLAD